MSDGLLYRDPETGHWISTHSMLKTFRRCPKQFEYKYVERLKPKILGRPLRLGTWMHKLQEVHGRGGDWREAHEEMRRTVWANLFDEEKEDIGDLPGDCERLMRSYLWYYEGHEWKIVESEITLECELPDGSIYRCRLDWIVEWLGGLWIVDHKWHKKLPDFSTRVLDSQSADYIWCAIKNKLPVQGFVWDYGLSKPATYPRMLKSGAGPMRWANCATDFPTMVEWFKREMGGRVPQACKPKMRSLRNDRYVLGQPQHSPFFRRHVLERTAPIVNRIAREMYHTHKRMHAYPFDRTDMVERVPDRSCSWMCSYEPLCSAELITGNRPINWQRSYKVGDPMDYYYDREQVGEELN